MFTYRGPMMDFRCAFILACLRHHGRRATRVGFTSEDYAASCWLVAGVPEQL